MALVTSKEMFAKAYDGGYAIGAFNVNNMEIVQGITEACQEEHAPVILQVSKGARAYANHTYLVKLVEAAVECCPDIPIVLHLDHGPDFETCKSCIDGGFTSVMIDGSSKSFEDNIALTKSVADAGRAMGVPVEAELGKVGGKEDDGPAVEGESPYTDPAEAKEFVERTGCTSLAIGVGTSHGVYTSDPHIEQSVVKAIRDAVDVPLVLHGGSGTSEEDFKACIRNGICKINVATAIQIAAAEAVAEYLARGGSPGYIGIKRRIIEASQRAVAEHIRLFESDGKA